VFLTRSGTPAGAAGPAAIQLGHVGRRTSFPAGLPDLALPGGAVYDALAAAARARAAAGDAAPAGSTDLRALDADLEILPHRQDQDS